MIAISRQIKCPHWQWGSSEGGCQGDPNDCLSVPGQPPCLRYQANYIKFPNTERHSADVLGLEGGQPQPLITATMWESDWVKCSQSASQVWLFIIMRTTGGSVTVSVRGRGRWAMMSVTQLDKSLPYWRLITNFVLKTKNLNHLYIQNMNKKFIMDQITVHISSHSSSCLGGQIIILHLRPLRRCHRNNGDFRIGEALESSVKLCFTKIHSLLEFGSICQSFYYVNRW